MSLVWVPMQIDATFTVGEMAHRLARTGAPEEVALLTRQLRNWTAMRLLAPVGEVHQGTGRHRRYDDVTLLKAALLELMARALKVDVTGLQEFSRVFDLMRAVRSMAPMYLTAPAALLSRQSPLYLYLPLGNMGAFEVSPGAPLQPEGEGYLAIDLTVVAKRVWRG